MKEAQRFHRLESTQLEPVAALSQGGAFRPMDTVLSVLRPVPNRRDGHPLCPDAIEN